MKTSYGITGGIASGKSAVCRLLRAMGHPVFYCDDEAKRIIRTDPDVRRELTAVVGEGVYDDEGRLVKSVLAAYICRGGDCSERVDAIVHPRVREAYKAWHARQTAETTFMECALLFESGFDRLVDRTVLVHTRDEVRLARLMARDGISRAQARKWMALQMTEEEKLARADIVISNDGTPEELEREVRQWLEARR